MVKKHFFEVNFKFNENNDFFEVNFKYGILTPTIGYWRRDNFVSTT